MTSSPNEAAFESQVDRLLQQGGWQPLPQRGSEPGDANGWDVKRALFPSHVCTFLEATQPAKWAAMRKLHGDGLGALVVDALVKELQIKGTLHVLRHGFKFRGRVLRMAHFKPAHGLNDQMLALYDQTASSWRRRWWTAPRSSSRPCRNSPLFWAGRVAGADSADAATAVEQG